jgi:hypothetical protein
MAYLELSEIIDALNGYARIVEFTYSTDLPIETESDL